MRALSDTDVAMLITGLTLFGYGAYFGCRQLKRVWNGGPDKRFDWAERGVMAINLATLHVGGTLIALACNPLHPDNLFTTRELVLNNLLWPAVYFPAMMFARRLHIALDKPCYSVTWRDGRDALLFAASLGAIALAGM